MREDDANQIDTVLADDFGGVIVRWFPMIGSVFVTF